jgi:isoleucyl-tRNA synthetase
LASLVVTHKFNGNMLAIISEEVNVKEVVPEGSEIKLDTNLTEELKSEGVARDIIRAIQDIRKKENLNPSDNIKLIVSAGSEIVSIFDSYDKMIKGPTGVTSIEFSKEKQTHIVALEAGEMSLAIVK